MKQKVVIRLSLNGNGRKYRTKVFKIAVSQSGVESAAITGDGKNQLEVVGEVDAATLTSLLRKNLGQADLVSVGPAGGGPAAAAPASGGSRNFVSWAVAEPENLIRRFKI